MPPRTSTVTPPAAPRCHPSRPSLRDTPERSSSSTGTARVTASFLPVQMPMNRCKWQLCCQLHFSDPCQLHAPPPESPVFAAVFHRFPCASVPIPRHVRKTESDPPKTAGLSGAAGVYQLHLPRRGRSRFSCPSGKGKTTWHGAQHTRRGSPRSRPAAGRGTRPQGGDQMEIRSTTDRAIRRSRRSYSAVVCG